VEGGRCVVGTTSAKHDKVDPTDFSHLLRDMPFVNTSSPRLLSQLEATPPSPLEIRCAPQAASMELAAQVAEIFKRHARQPVAQMPPPQPLRAYLLVDGWSEHWLKARLESFWPDSVAERTDIPVEENDPAPERRLSLVPIPEHALLGTEAPNLGAVMVQEQLASLLERAWRDMLLRQVRLHLCGILLSRRSPGNLRSHLRALMVQRPLDYDQPILFRGYDPRVVQRIWFCLSDTQKHNWLGPIAEWLVLQQPWHEWRQEEVREGQQSEGAPLVHSTPTWFALAADLSHVPAQVGSFRLTRMLQPGQLLQAGWSEYANHVWQGLDTARRANLDYYVPDGPAMTGLLHTGQQLGLAGNDLEDYVWHCCCYGNRQMPLDWRKPPWGHILRTALASRNTQTDTRFATLLERAMTQHELPGERYCD